MGILGKNLGWKNHYKNQHFIIIEHQTPIQDETNSLTQSGGNKKPKQMSIDKITYKNKQNER